MVSKDSVCFEPAWGAHGGQEPGTLFVLSPLGKCMVPKDLISFELIWGAYGAQGPWFFRDHPGLTLCQGTPVFRDCRGLAWGPGSLFLPSPFEAYMVSFY